MQAKTSESSGAAAANNIGGVGSVSTPTDGSLALPVPPSANRYWRVFRGRAVKSQEARDYQATVFLLAKKAKAKRIAAPAGVVVTMVWHLGPDRRTHSDLDNRWKVLGDALQGVIWDDDKQITELHLFRRNTGGNKIVVSWRAA